MAERWYARLSKLMRHELSGRQPRQPVLSIVDVNRGAREQEHEFADLDEIYNPAWSPDGRSIAFPR